MRVNIVTYNKKKVRHGSILCYTGFALLLINITPFVGEKLGLPINCSAIVLILLGSFMIIYYQNKLSNRGYITIAEERTKIHDASTEVEIVNKEYKVHFSGSGYKGASNYKPFLSLGAFTTNPGINKISFFNDKEKYEYEILINSKNDFTQVIDLTERYFKK
jgi:hypothetical protein